MTIPDYQSIMLPLLELAGDGETHNIHTAKDTLANQFELVEEEVSLLLPSGKQQKFANRVGWARTYLKKSGLLIYPSRGQFKITERGKKVLEDDPQRITNEYLRQFPEFIEFRKRTRKTTLIEEQANDEKLLTPEEALESAYVNIRNDLADDLLEYVMKSPPYFFESLVVNLLVAMGYGGTQQDAARAVGKSGDEGIDGIIDEDRLGLDSIYIQAKRWQKDTKIGRPQIQTFVGALQGRKAKKSVFITTASFTNQAREYAAGIDTKIVLIDGIRLADLMIDFGVGVTTSEKYEIKKIDLDYFVEISSE